MNFFAGLQENMSKLKQYFTVTAIAQLFIALAAFIYILSQLKNK